MTGCFHIDTKEVAGILKCQNGSRDINRHEELA